MKFQSKKALTADQSQNLPISMFGRKQSNFIKKSSNKNLSHLFQRLFLFNNKDKNNLTDNKDFFVPNSSKTGNNETRSLQDIENCANAAREIEAFDQYDWINKADE
jgi:hypothetical protein